MSSNSSSDLLTEVRSVFESSNYPSEPLSTREVADALRFSTERVAYGLETLCEQDDLNMKTIGESRVWWQPRPSSEENIDSQTHDDKDRRRLALFENIQDIANVGAWEYDIVNDESWVTDEVRRIHGFPLDADIPPEKSLNCYHPDDRSTIRDAFERAVTEQESYDLELRLIDTNGNLHWVRTRGHAQFEDGETVRVHGTLQDITERKERQRELKETLLQLEGVLDSVQAAVWLRDADGRYLLVNQQWRELFDMDDEKVIGRTPQELFPEALADQFGTNHRQAITTGESVELEEEVPIGQETRTYLTRITPVYDEADDVYAACGIATDITDQKQREQQLKRHRGLVEKTQSLARVGGYEIDIESGAFTWQSGISRLLETSSDGAVTNLSDAFEYVHPADRDHIQSVTERTIAERSQFSEEFRIVTDENNEKWIRMVAETTTRDDTVLLQGTFQNITERTRRERKLERLNRAIEKAPIGVVMTDPTRDDNPLIYVNEAFQDITGYPEEECLGRNCRFLQGEDTRDEPVRQLREAVNNSESVAVELRNYTRDGEKFWNHVSIAPVENADGDILTYVGFQQDITERKHREATLRKREQTLRELHATTHDLLNAHDESDVAQCLVDSLTDIFDMESTGVMWFDEDDGEFRTATMSSSLADVFDEPPIIEPGDNPLWHVYRDGETRRLTSGEVWDGCERVDDPMTEWVVTPIGDFGLLLAATRDSEGISDDAVDPLELLTANSNAVLERIFQRRESAALSEQLQTHQARVDELEQVMDAIRAIQRRVAHSDTRDAIETAVCEELVATDPVDFAWIGHPQTADTDLSPEIWAGRERGYLDMIERNDGTWRPAHRAAEQRHIQNIPAISQHVHSGDWAKTALGCEFNSVISLPVTYDGVLYGVLTAYSEHDDAFEQIYEALFEDVASFLGTYVSMLVQRTTDTDREVSEFEFELTDETYPLHTLAVETGCTIRFDTLLEMSDEAVRVLVTVQEGDAERVLAAAESMIHITDAEWFGDEESRQLSLTVERPFLASRVRNHGGRLVDSVSDGETTQVCLHLPSNVAHRPVIEALSTQYRDIDLRSQTTKISERQVPASSDELLTDRQREILSAAYYGGYYDTPRGVTGEDLAENFGISGPVVYDHLKAGHHALLDRLFTSEFS